MNYSVLMSVYYKETPEFLKESIESMLAQTILTNDFVLVCDGKLTKELDEVVEYYEKNYSDIFNIIRLEKNIGLGNALNIGINKCKNELIARMDSDDISVSNRCEIQLKCFKDNNIDIVSGFANEFSEDVNKVVSVRKVPENHEEILNFMKKRNPFNHPCVMYRKKAVIKAGNYKEFNLYEDYYLWIRMIQEGSIGYNIQKSIVNMRAGKELYSRRGGFSYFYNGRRFQKYLLSNKCINTKEYLINICGRFCIQVILPNFIRSYAYKKMLRK